MKKRNTIISECMKQPYMILFAELGDYDDYTYEYKTPEEATKKYFELIREMKQRNRPYIIQMVKRLVVDSEE